MTITKEQIIEGIKKLTLSETVELIHELEEVFGVSAHVPPSLATIAQLQTNGEPTMSEQAEYDICLVSHGEKKLDVIKVVRSLFQVPLRQAKDIVDVGGVLKTALFDEATDIKSELESVGATVELR